jgi:hypothetical protein
MKTFIVALIASIISLSVFAQSSYTVTGKVINADTKAPLQGASVFAENTTLGTATDAEGNFTLYLPNGGYDVVISFIDYYTESKRVSNDNQGALVFELRRKEKTMQAVTIGGTGEVKDGWNKYGKFFIEEFIGKSANAQNCTLKNTDVLKFYFSKRKNRLKVLANEPLQIENKALGYNIRYDLDSFTHEYNNEVSFYTGYPLFEEINTASEETKQRWSEARRQSYMGSVLHFMRSVHRQKLSEEGFEVQFVVKVNGNDTAIKVKNFYGALNYQRDDSTQLVLIRPNQPEMGVIYNKEKPSAAFLTENPNEPSAFQFSTLTFQPKQSLHIEQNGYYYEQQDITTNAYWAWLRLGDALPYDYEPK